MTPKQLKFVYKVLFLSVFGWISVTTHAQMFDYKSILSKPYNERITDMGAIRLRLAKTADKNFVDKELNLIEQTAQQRHNSQDLLREAVLVKTYCYNYNSWQSPQTSIQQIQTAIQGIKSTDSNYYIKVFGLMQIAEIYWEKVKNYENFFETYNKLIDFVKNVKQEDYPDIIEVYRRLGDAYYSFGDYENSIKYLKMGAAFPETPQNYYFLAHTYNGLGMSYQKLNQLDISNMYFNKIFSLKYNPNKEQWDGIASGNIGHNEYLRKNYDKAIPLCIKDVNIAVKNEDYGLAVGSLIPLGDIYLERNQLEKAKQCLDSARQFIQLSGETNLFRSYYSILSKWYIKQGNKEKAIAYSDSANIAREEYNKNFNSLKLLRVQQKIANQQIEINEAKLRAAHYRNNMFMALLAGIIIISVLLLLYLKRREQIKSAKKEIELKSIENQLQLTNYELKRSQSNLDNFMKSVFEKNQLIEELNDQLKIQEKLPALEQLQHSIILTQEDWDTFQNLFDEVYPGYRFQLKQKNPSLTSAELRYLLLEKLQLSTKEMASMLGVSPNAVQVTRHRLHKKSALNLPLTS